MWSGLFASLGSTGRAPFGEPLLAGRPRRTSHDRHQHAGGQHRHLVGDPRQRHRGGQCLYGNVFGWTFATFGDDSAYAGIESGGDLIGGLYRSDAPPTEEAGVRVYVNVSDLE